MSEIQQAPEQGVVIANILPTLKDMPAVLSSHQVSVTAAVASGETLIARCKASPQMTADLDKEAEALIIKLNKTVEKLEGNRKPFTQMMAEIAKMFTGEEKKLEPVLANLKGFRNQRAKEVIEENRRLEAEAAVRTRKANEKADIVALINKRIGDKLIAKLYSRQKDLDTAFNQITLANYEEKAANLRALRSNFPTPKLDEIIAYEPIQGFREHTREEIELIEIQVKKDYFFEAFYDKYALEMDEYVEGLRARLPSKLAELKQAEISRIAAEKLAAEQEKQRIENERLRQEQLQAKSKADQAAAAERQRLADIRTKELEQQQAEQKKEQDRQAEETRQRQAEQDRLNAEKQEAEEEKNRQAAEMKSAELKAGNLFSQVASAGEKQIEGETRKGWLIRVTVPAGWALIFQQWFTGKAVGMDPEKMGAVKLDQMKAYCEDIADTTKIVSPYLVYEETVTAVNRKKKAGA